MARAVEILRRIVFLLRRNQMDNDLAEEMRDHLERKAEKNRAAGMTEKDAAYAARRQLGNLALQHEQSRASWGFPLLESVLQDVRYGLRGLRKAPGFSTVAVLTLALGIGATSAIFSITNAVLLRPLPYKDSNRLVHVWTMTARFPEFRMGNSKPDFDELRARARCFEAVASYQPQYLTITGTGEPEQISAAAVSSDFLRLFSVQPLLGHAFQPGDEDMKNGHVVLLSYGLWQRRFAGDPAVVGKEAAFDQIPYSVAGVLPKGFTYPEADAWVPLVITGKDRIDRNKWAYFTLGKLKPAVSVRDAQGEMDRIQDQIVREYPKEESDVRLNVMPLRDGVVHDGTKSELATLLGAVGFLLLIGCANVSNLILSRSVQRGREISLRAALGASRGRILRQLLIESLLLALAGGLVGMLIAGACLGAFRAFSPPSFSRLDEVRLEPAVALIALAVSSVAGVLCGLAPALHTSRPGLTFALRERTGSAPLTKRFSLRNFLVVSEISLALALLTGSALMVQSLARLLRVDTGFRTDHLLTARIDLARPRYPSADAQRIFLERLLEALRAEPQFKGMALANNSMMTGSTALTTFDPATVGSNEKPTNLEAKSVSPGFFEALGIPVVSGRSFNDRDTKGSPQVSIISESLARRFFPGKDPLGRILKFGPDPEDRFQIVGVVADTRDIHLDAKVRLQVYFPLLQDPYSSMSVMVRSSADPLMLANLLQQRVWSVDKDQPLTKLNSMTAVIAQSVAEPRFRTWLLSAFAAAGLALTLIGIYGVISYSVSQRTQEMGIRIALGAQAGDVRRLILTQGLWLALIGAAAGVLGSLGLMRLLASQLYEVKPGDPLTLAGAALLMLVVALCASYVPARRATKVDPMVALRHE